MAAVNDAPDAQDDAKDATEDTPLTFPASDLTANDTDVENDTLTVTAVGDATHGTVELQNGQITYTPDSNYCGAGELHVHHLGRQRWRGHGHRDMSRSRA